MDSHETKLAEVFKDAKTHQLVSHIILKHLTNKHDVRIEALKGLDFKNAKKILDLGCGFGFFTRALKDLVSSRAVITGIDRHDEYKDLYLHSCRNTGLKGKFIGDGIETLKNIETNSIDLILCSYAMYFFPHIVSEVARILKHNGIFVIITHAIPHMREFTDYVKSILKQKNIHVNETLPYEKLISKFSNQNGCDYLDPCFDNTLRRRYSSKLLFKKDDFKDFVEYFNFKHTFFIPENIQHELKQVILQSVKKDLDKGKTLSITKDDIIFVCTFPRKHN